MEKKNQAEVTYLFHSGFAVKTAEHLLVFDYYKDEQDCMSSLMAEGKKVWIFSSHSHNDHFNPVVKKWQDQVKGYVFSHDLKNSSGVKDIRQDKIWYLPPYEKKELADFTVSSYGSTDEGISFLVEVDGWSIFHAGDLNWWHWKGDTLENQQTAAQLFRQEMEHLSGIRADVAFFPVDSRLEECRTMGVEVFCRTAKVQQLVAMHTCGEVWKPNEAFAEKNPAISVWCPEFPGEKKFFKKG